MPSQWRRVQVAPGHKLLARRVAADQPVDDRVLIATKRRGQFRIAADRWDAAEVHHG